MIFSGGNTYLRSASSLVLVTPHPKSAPSKINVTKSSNMSFGGQSSGSKLMGDAMKSYKSNITLPAIPDAVTDPEDIAKEQIDALQDLQDSDDEDDQLAEDIPGEDGQQFNQDDYQHVGLMRCHTLEKPKKLRNFV